MAYLQRKLVSSPTILTGNKTMHSVVFFDGDLTEKGDCGQPASLGSNPTSATEQLWDCDESLKHFKISLYPLL